MTARTRQELVALIISIDIVSSIVGSESREKATEFSVDTTRNGAGRCSDAHRNGDTCCVLQRYVRWWEIGNDEARNIRVGASEDSRGVETFFTKKVKGLRESVPGMGTA